MKELEERIRRDGTVKTGDVLKVDAFLNHQCDVRLFDHMGQEWARHFAGKTITKILTIEASGIGIACCAARHFGDVPVVFAKKAQSINLDGDQYTTTVYSFTKRKEFPVIVSKKYLDADDHVLLIDADFQHPLEMLAEMHGLWQSGYEMIYGVIADRGAESGAKRMGTQLFYRVMNSGSSVKMPPNAGDFRWMDRKVVDALKALPENNRFMKGLYAWVGFKTVALPFVPKDRAAGNSSFNLRRLGSLALLGLTSFTTLPLRIWSMVGAGISLLALAYGLWIAAEALFFGNPLRGWPTLAASIMLFSGVQLLSIGILGEYIGRIYEEVKRRPTYLVARDEDNSPWRDS